MTENDSNSSPQPEVNREDETTHIAQRDSTREMPLRPSQQSSWSGATNISDDDATQAAMPSEYPSAPASSYYPSAPQQNGTSWTAPQSPSRQAHQGYNGGFNPPSAQSGGSTPQGAWSPQAQGSQRAFTPSGTAHNAYGSAPHGSWSGQPNNPYSTGQSASGYGSYSPQQPFGAPGQQQFGQPYSAAPFGPNSGVQKPAAGRHQLSPLEKFGPFLPAFVAFLAAFLTWVTFKSGAQTVSLNGVGGNSNNSNPDLGGAKSTGGWITIVFALGLVGVAVIAILGKLRAIVVALATIALSALILIIALVQFANVNAVVNSDAGYGYSGTIAIGVWLTLFAGLVGVGLGLAGILAARKNGAGKLERSTAAAGLPNQNPYSQATGGSAGNRSWNPGDQSAYSPQDPSWGQRH